MKTETHLDLARQWDVTLSKLDPQEDHTAIIEICMMMGTAFLNAILHKRGIREDEIDQNHTTRPKIPEEVEAKITPDIRAIMDDLHYIEQMRGLHCRGISGKLRDPRDLPAWDPAVSEKCLVNIRKIQAFAEQVMAE
jgi:hypothetical protein